jgi:hypothetical protein
MGILPPPPTSTTTLPAPIQAAPPCPADLLSPQQRQTLALDALSGHSLSDLARRHRVSRRFVARQRQRAQQALAAAFTLPPPPDEQVLFALPVTWSWLQQFVLALLLIGHSSLRGVHELLRDLFDFRLSVGALHALVQQAIAQATAVNAQQDLSRVWVAALDEIFQTGSPILSVVDVTSTYCCWLGLEEHRDATTWGVRLLELQDQGFHPQATIADGGTGLRAGQKLALPDVPCRADVFHLERDLGQAVRFLENRAYAAMAACDKLQRPRPRRPRADATPRRTQQQAAAREQERAVALADDVATLARWLQRDVLSLAGPPLAQRRELFDFVLRELDSRGALCPHRLKPVCRTLAKQREELLAFVDELDRDVGSLAAYACVPEAVVRELVAVQEAASTSAGRWQRDAVLRQQLGAGYHRLSVLVETLRGGVVRASSVVENVNSRLRNYFFLRKEVGGGYLELLRFFLNHRRFLRSAHPERVGKSPAELLSGEEKPHWLELLGYQRFRRAA